MPDPSNPATADGGVKLRTTVDGLRNICCALTIGARDDIRIPNVKAADIALDALAAHDLRDDITNAVKCAKEYDPDYPWSLNTASEAVWALGEGGKGIEAACEEWRERSQGMENARDIAFATVSALQAELAECVEGLRRVRNAIDVSSFDGVDGVIAAIGHLSTDSATLAKVREIAGRATPALVIGLRCAADDSPSVAATEIREAVAILKSLASLLAPAPAASQEQPQKTSGD